MFANRLVLAAGPLWWAACVGSDDGGTASTGLAVDTGPGAETGADAGSTVGGPRVTGGTSEPSTTEPPTVACSDTVAIDVGVGEFVFEPLDDVSDGIRVVFGAQGGWHIDIAGSVSGTGAEVAVDAPRVTLVGDGAQIAGGNQQPLYLPLTGYDVATCSGTFVAARTFVDDHLPDIPYDAWVCSLEGALAEVHLVVSDLNDFSITGSNTAIGTIVLDEAFKQESCR